MTRTWVKLYCRGWLEGSIRDEEPEVRAVFVDLLVLAGSSQHGQNGEIMVSPGVGLTSSQVQKVLRISRKLWQKAREKLQKSGRIMFVSDTGIITICNWGKYQSEYERQRPYREKSCNFSLQGEVTAIEGRGESIEKRKENVDADRASRVSGASLSSESSFPQKSGDDPWKG